MVAIYTNTQHIYTVTNKIFVKTFYEMWKKDKIFTARKCTSNMVIILNHNKLKLYKKHIHEYLHIIFTTLIERKYLMICYYVTSPQYNFLGSKIGVK